MQLSTWFVKNLIAAIVLPPASLLLLMLLGLLLLPRRRSAGVAILVIDFVLLWALCTPYVGHLMLGHIGESKPFDPSTLQYYKPDDRPQAIVVMGAGRHKGAREFDPAGTSTDPLLPEALTATSLARLRYAAWLSRTTSLPLLVSGGSPEGGQLGEASLMKLALEKEFATPVRWVEDEATSTADSARRAAALLKPQGVKRVLIVTDYWHGPRSRAAFRDAGLDSIAAPMGFTAFDPSDPREWLPTSRGLSMSRTALREVAGDAVSRVAAWIPGPG